MPVKYFQGSKVKKVFIKEEEKETKEEKVLMKTQSKDCIQQSK
jgi:hypothetical protein